MRANVWTALGAGCWGLLMATSLAASPWQHEHGAGGKDVQPPRVFLDKSRRIVDFQLTRLENERLLLVERGDDDPKYLPVHETILKREGITASDKEAALSAMVSINGTDPVSELLSVLEGLDPDDRSQLRVGDQLAGLLLSREPSVLSQSQALLATNAQAESPLIRKVGFAGLLASGSISQARELADDGPRRASLYESIPLVNDAAVRNQLRDSLVKSLGRAGVPVQRAALVALRSITSRPQENFQAVAAIVDQQPLRAAAIKTLLGIDRAHRDPKTAKELATFLVTLAEATPPAQRTSDTFLEAMQLADQLLGLIDVDLASDYRARLGKVTVRVVLIHTVEEEMRYDLPWFAVQAGSDVQVVLRNEDIMPHNLVFTVPGKLQEVALAGAALGPSIGPSGKQYVPDSPDVLHATRMIQSDQQARLTFAAPTEPGAYPYVCTFPGHWMRMYGVMVVVDDLASFQRNPVEPKDPVGSNRALVQVWKPGDFQELESGLRGRSAEIGHKIFVEATCATCHKFKGEGKEIGPDLTEVFQRWKGDSRAVLREIIEPSHRIEAKYLVRKIITLDGEILSGIVLEEDADSISILPSPEAPEATRVDKDDIDQMVNSSVSIMPKGLMDRFTRDEILELLAYLRGP